jgi:uncharacterized protein with FMN-binding domain
MKLQTRTRVANSFLALSALAGGLFLTNHFAPSTQIAGPASTPSTSGGPTPTASSSGKTGTATSDPIQYQFGQIQLSVTEANGKITAIDYGSSSASGGRQAAFPYLVTDAIKSQGANFGNLSGATYTTAAFKQALTNAIAKI